MIKDLFSAATTTLIACAALQPYVAAAAKESAANQFMHQADFKELAARFEDPARAAWQRPEKVIANLGPLAGKTVADIGAGTGYFSFPIAKQAAKVIAIDIDQRFLDYIEQKKQTQKIGANIETRLTKPDSPGLKRGEADLVLIVDTYHHIEGRVEYFKKLKKCLRKDRVLAII
ncbi:MAG: class I SAM-dependent methyltransferase, partial [Chthoniobacterales bacterium]